MRSQDEEPVKSVMIGIDVNDDIHGNKSDNIFTIWETHYD